MKNVFILATMFLTFGVARAQKIYSVSNQAYLDWKNAAKKGLMY